MKLIKSKWLVLFFVQSSLLSTFVHSQNFELFTKGVVCEDAKHKPFNEKVLCFLNPYPDKIAKIDMALNSDPNALIKNKKFIEYQAKSARFYECNIVVNTSTGAAFLARSKNNYSKEYIYKSAMGHEHTLAEFATDTAAISEKIVVDVGYNNRNKSDAEVVKIAWEKCFQQSLEPYIKEAVFEIKQDIADYEPDDED